MPPVPSVVPALSPTLSDGTVTLRPVTPGDASAIVEQSRDAETVRWTTVPSDYTREDAEAFVHRVGEERAAGRRTTWVVESEGAFAGLVALRPLSTEVA